MEEIRKQANDVRFLSFNSLGITRYLALKVTDFAVANYAGWTVQARNNTMTMPSRVQRIEEFVNELEAGDLKLRVRVLEVLLPPTLD